MRAVRGGVGGEWLRGMRGEMRGTVWEVRGARGVSVRVVHLRVRDGERCVPGELPATQLFSV